MNNLYVVGIGPGNADGMTLRALNVLRSAEVIVGYKVYNDLIKPIFPDKTYLYTPMRQETERCQMAIDIALTGKTTAVISSGDPGVYGMASLILELCKDNDKLNVEIIPGVTAALSGSALLGAPLGHDFAVISLSDALTPWETIEKRLRLSAQAKLCIALYNPASSKRPDYLTRACDVLLEYLAPDTPCGIAANIGRERETAKILTLSHLRLYPADMFTTVFIGTSTTRIIGEHLITPRGYRSGEKNDNGKKPTHE